MFLRLIKDVRGKCLENVDETHLVLASGRPVPKKHSKATESSLILIY